MKPKPLTVLADDLTGACELAAIGHQWGLSTAVHTRLDAVHDAAELAVYDTETRLDPPPVAAEKLRRLTASWRDQFPERLLYKKTDSVIRGPIAAELEVLLEGLPCRRSLFLPANPGLGRIVRHGKYFVDGVPLAQTGFARDLHHPARSSVVRELLDGDTELEISQRRVDEPLPHQGIIIGDADSDTVLEQWAQRLDATTLPSGAASFFRALLKRDRGPAPDQPKAPDIKGRTLLVSGTTDPGQREVLARLETMGFPAATRGLDQLDASGSRDWAREVLDRLQEHQRCLACVDQSVTPDPERSGLVRKALAEMAAKVLQAGGLRHLVVEGGATAASICEAMDWNSFTVAHVWAQGIVSLHPAGQPELLFTLKPGSYPWPENFTPVIAGSTATKA